jgi:hypothetical protein
LAQVHKDSDPTRSDLGGEVANLDLDVEMIAVNNEECVSELASNSAHSESDLVRLIFKYGLVDLKRFLLAYQRN